MKVCMISRKNRQPIKVAADIIDEVKQYNIRIMLRES